MNINDLITELVNYGKDKGLVDTQDVIYTTNRLLELFQLTSYTPADTDGHREIHLILNDMSDYAVSKGFIEDTITNRDLFDTKIMGLLTPPPSVVRSEFSKHYTV